MGGNINSLVHGLSFQNPSGDAFVFFIWIIVSLIYSFSAGRGRIISILVSIYMAELLVIQAPFLSAALGSKLGIAVYLGRLIAFLVLFLFFFFVFSKYVFRTSVDNRGFSSWFFGLIFSFLQIGFLVSVIFSFLPPDMQGKVAPLTHLVFVSQTAQFVWLLAPIIFLVFMGRFISDHRYE